MEKAQTIERYLNAVKKYRILADKEEKHLIILSVLRLVSFIGGFVAIWFGFAQSNLAGSLLILLVASLFLYLLKLYWVHSDKREFLNNLVLISQNEADAIAGDLSAFESGSTYIDTEHDFSNDVDLFGDSSIFQYMNRTVSGYGRDILAGWLSDPYAVSPDFKSRQEVIRELAMKEKWRHEFMASGMKTPLEKSDIDSLMEWMNEPAEIQSSPIKKFLIYFFPSLTVLCFILLIAGVLHYSVFTFIFLTNLLYISTGLNRTNKIHKALSRKYIYLTSIDGMLKSFEKESFSSEGLNDIKMNITGGNLSATISVKTLSRLIQSFDSRINMLIGLVLNGMFLWDFHCVYKLEKWKSVYKDLFPVWLDMLGQVDAYISLGNYAWNNNDFAYPVLSDNKIFYARNLGHQLIDESKRVCNDFTLGQKGIVCIISGANMAGKSTFLRTIAINYILGMVGAPVCASEMTFTPLHLFTSMRTTDSLSNSESYFYAELKRLKILKSRIEDGANVLFILDEILKGTNSEDKSLGSKLFLERIIEQGGTGLIATHDISLGEMENDHPGIIINKCFEIEIDGEIIKFDYKLQDGITHKMNATLLMKQMGISM